MGLLRNHSKIVHLSELILVVLLILSINQSQGRINNQNHNNEDKFIQPQEEEAGTNDQFTESDFTNPIHISKHNSSKQYSAGISSKPIDFEISKNYIARGTIDVDSNADFETLGFPGSGTVSDPYIIEGYSIEGSELEYAISIRDTTSYFEIRSNYISSAEVGIQLYQISNGLIYNNTINNSSWKGISVYRSSNNVISSNIIFNSSRDAIGINESPNNIFSSNIITDARYGLTLRFSPDNILEDNIFENSGLELWGDLITDVAQIKVENNTVNGFPLIFLQHLNNNVISGDAGQIILVNCTYIEIENKIISNTSSAIQIFASSFNTISLNTIANNTQEGIDLHFSSNNLISSNKITDNLAYGIYLYSSDSNVITSNIFANNSVNGIKFFNSEINEITSNIIVNNSVNGINLAQHSNKNIIYLNIISNNSYYGIYIEGAYLPLDASSDNNIISFNTIKHNSDYGIYFDGSYFTSGNLIKFNNFITNTSRNLQAYDNSLDNNFKFNYWNDLISPDIDENGLVDEPYLIDGETGNFDIYPLTIPVGEVVHSLYVDNPIDVFYDEGSNGNNIFWNVGGKNPGEYYVTLNGKMYTEPTLWVQGVIEVDVDGLRPGVYTLSVHVLNIYGSQISDSVVVTVDEIPILSTSTNLTNPGNTESITAFTQSPFSFALLFPILIVQYLRKKAKFNRTAH